jgi:ribosomal protein L31E
MVNTTVKFNKKSLAAHLGMDIVTLNNLINTFLTEEAIKKEYGIYRFRRFSNKQLEIIERETGFKIF